MTVASIREYQGPQQDTLDKFHGAQLLYVGWDHHLLFCAPFCFPLPPNFVFGDLITQVFPPAFGYHPEYAKIDWATVEWFKSSKPFKPDLAKSLAENELVHKDTLRFRTPGLTGIKGSGA
jgi:phenol hydroxylase P4 protein